MNNLGRLLEQALQQSWNYITRDPNFRKYALLTLRNILMQEPIRGKIENSIEDGTAIVAEGTQHIWETITRSIRVRIDSRKKEVEVVAKEVKSYLASDVSNSILNQGENISVINNQRITFNFNFFNIENVKQLETYSEKLNEQDHNLNIVLHTEGTQEQIEQNFKKIDRAVKELETDIGRTIDKLTDYSLLQAALKTGEEKSDE